MSQLSKIPASAYTSEMETLGALPDIPTFDGEPVPVSQNPLTPRTRPLQLLPLPVVAIGLRFEVYAYVNSRVTQVGVAWRGCSSMNSCVTQLLLNEQLRDATGCMSYEMVFRFWAERIRTRLEAWRELPEEARPAAPAYTREERDQAARSFLFYIISSQLLCTSQNKGDPVVLACLRDLSQVGSFDWPHLVWLTSIMVWMSRPVVAVSQTGCSSGLWR
ncbi:hypothetical protein JCGZ_05369 [Jatropha curcas]|uniref:Aminotransferase-like plant mobile domain-containing protein n=1 Tax=Jatropha curcas TaxID=180498 RepID=A0A067J9R7_JATCU|nr:hypothetical protein JCGZ_05369 [Jatropha curcas]